MITVFVIKQLQHKLQFHSNNQNANDTENFMLYQCTGIDN